MSTPLKRATPLGRTNDAALRYSPQPRRAGSPEPAASADAGDADIDDLTLALRSPAFKFGSPTVWPAPASFYDLSIELVLEVCRWLEPCDLLSLRATCRSLSVAADDDASWRVPLARNFPSAASSLSGFFVGAPDATREQFAAAFVRTVASFRSAVAEGNAASEAAEIIGRQLAIGSASVASGRRAHGYAALLGVAEAVLGDSRGVPGLPFADLDAAVLGLTRLRDAFAAALPSFDEGLRRRAARRLELLDVRVAEAARAADIASEFADPRQLSLEESFEASAAVSQEMAEEGGAAALAGL